MKKHLLILSALLMFMGCSKVVDVQLDPEVTVFLSSSEEKVHLTSSDAEYLMLKQWLEQHKTSWLSTSGKYSGGIYLTSGNYGIQVTDSKVVLYSSIENNPTAIYAQEIERSDLRALKDLSKL